MPTLSELKGRPVISLNEGQKVGTIKDALIDPVAKTVGGFLLQGNDGELALPYSHIRAIGPDAVTIESAMSTQSPVGEGGLEGLRKFGDFTKEQVVDASGVHHGHLGDATFSETGALTEVEIHSGGFLGLNEKKTDLLIGSVRSFGTNVVTIEAWPDEPAA